MKKYEHGGNIYKGDIRYDFSANINPLGMPQGVRNAIIDSVDEYTGYPDPNCTKLRTALAARENLMPEQIVCGNGAADLIHRIAAALHPRRGLVCAPAFCEYEKALKENGCQVDYYYLTEKDGFELTEGILEKLTEETDICFLCNPNNPTGSTIASDFMGLIAKRCLEKDIILVADECFLDFVKDREQKTAGKWMNSNLIILKAFTKIYAMAGLRLGYAIFGSPALAAKISSSGQCWSVSGPAQAAGEAALAEKEYLEKTVEYVERERKYLAENLKELGFCVYPGEANFLFFFDKKRRPLDRLLLKEGIAVRNCDNFEGLYSGYYRIAVRTHIENRFLTDAMRRVLGEETERRR